MKILIVDDEKRNRDIHKHIFLRNNFNENDIREAENGEKGITIANSEDISLFLIDYHMPKLNGIDVIKELRKNCKYKNTPIIMISSDNCFTEEAIEAGANNYIVKPVRFEDFWKTVSNYINIPE